MIDTPEIVRTTAQATAVIRLTVPRADMPAVMGPGIGELMSTVARQGVGATGSIFAHHLRMDPATFDFELGVPVSAPIKPAGRVQPGQLPATTVARTVYHGPYEGLGPAWHEFEAWITANGHVSARDLWECYLTGPESGPDATRWRTEFNRPLVCRAHQPPS